MTGDRLVGAIASSVLIFFVLPELARWVLR
jgi:hypothetical protein